MPIRLALGLLTLLTAAAVAPSLAAGAAGYPAGLAGFDISWPQCHGGPPTDPFDFAVIGVNDGRAMTQNACFAQQVAWARQGAHAPSLYLNTNAPPDDYNVTACAQDAMCRSYHYGQDAAAYALSWANTAAADIGAYWLDVETANTWTADAVANAKVLQGMIEYLQAHGKSVGIYSTSYQYGKIAGSYAPGLPLWVPGVAHGPQDGPIACYTAPAFAGGRVAMVQWTWTYDGNYVCPFVAGPHRVVAPMVGTQ